MVIYRNNTSSFYGYAYDSQICIFNQYYIAAGKKYPIMKQDINQEKVAGIFIRITPLLPGQGYFDIAVLRI